MEYTSMLYVALVSVVGMTIQSSAGFGYGMLAMSIFPLFMSYTDALVVSALTSLPCNLILTLRHRKHVNIKMLLLPLIAFAVANAISTSFLVGMADALMRRALGATLILLAAYYLFFTSRVHIKASKLSGSICGGISGTLSSLFGMGGPPMALYLLDTTSEMQEYHANIFCFFVISQTNQFLVRAYSGLVSPDTIQLLWPSIVGMGVGVLISMRLIKNMNLKTLRYFIYTFMAIMGARMLIVG